MPEDVSQDQVAVIRIEGMHCHKCEAMIQKALKKYPDIHEVEVDFLSGQASVLYNRKGVSIPQMMDAVNAAGYKAVGFSQGQTARG